MAEVTGDLGGQPIQLNNAATEATLKQLLAAMLAMVAAQNKGTKKDAQLQKQLEAELKRLAKGAQTAQANLKKLSDQEQKEIEKKKQIQKVLNDEKKAHEKQIENLKKTVDALKTFANGIESAVGTITKVSSQFSQLGNSINAAAQTFQNIPIVGNMVSGVFGAIAQAGERSYKAFQQSATVGANFGGSIQEMINSATTAGMTIDQFAGVISKAGDNLALLGGSTEAGAKRLAKLGAEIQRSPLADQLYSLGYSTEDISAGMAKYSGILARTGRLQGMSNEQLAASSADYLKNLDALSKLTGKSKDALQQEEDARMRDAQYRIMMSKLDVKGQERMRTLMKSLPQEYAEGFKEIAAFGTATTDKGREFLAFMQQSGNAANGVFQEMRRTGTISEQTVRSAYDTIAQEGKSLSQSSVGELLASTGNSVQQGLVVAGTEMAARSKSFGQILDESAAATAAAAEKQKGALSPAELQKFQIEVAKISNEFTSLLANQMPMLKTAFSEMANVAREWLIPAFSYMADNIKIIVGTFGTLKLAMMAYKAKLAIEERKAALRGSTRLNPQYVEEVGGGRRTRRRGGAGGGKGGAPKKGLSIGTVGKIGGVVGAVTGLVGLAGDISDISEQEKAGEITADQAKEAKAGAVGGATGGAAGGWAGAAAGAAVGSVVPFIGTAIGGLIGGALGYWAGNKAGTQIGKAVVSSGAGKKLEAERKNEAEILRQTNQARQEEIDASKKLAESKKEEARANENVQLDFFNPQRLFDSFAKQQTQPGAQATASVSTPGGAVSTVPLNQDVTKNLELIKASLAKQGITDPKMIAATLGNVMKESGGKVIGENLNYQNTSNDRIRSIFKSATAGKSDAEINAMKSSPQTMAEGVYGATTKLGKSMGNTEPGDGWKYRGRGFIQLTGKNNYAAASKAIFGDDRLVQNPDMVNDPAVAAEVSAWFMKKNQGGMAKRLGIDTSNMTQAQANLLATSTIAGTAITPGQGYLGTTLDKVTGYSAQLASIAGTPATVSPSTTTLAAALPTAPTTSTTPAVTSTTSATTVASSSAVQGSRPGAPMAGGAASLNDVVASLEMLNKQIGQLVAISRTTADLNERQLSVQKNLGSDSFMAA
jgi:predicted chitinase